MKNRLFAGARASVGSYAHLLGLPSGRPKGEKDPNNDTEDEDARKARRAEEDKKREEEDARRAEEDKRREEEDARRAEEDGDMPGEGDEDGDAEDQNPADANPPADPEKNKNKGKGKGADDVDDDEEMKGRNAERARWVSVMQHKNAGQGRIAAACRMLETTDMPASAIIATLADLPTSATSGRQSLSERMASAKPVNPGAGSAQGAQPSLAAQIVQAGKVRRGEV